MTEVAGTQCPMCKVRMTAPDGVIPVHSSRQNMSGYTKMPVCAGSEQAPEPVDSYRENR